MKAPIVTWTDNEEEKTIKDAIDPELNVPLAKIDIVKTLDPILKHAHIAIHHLEPEFIAWCYAVAATRIPATGHAELFHKVEHLDIITENLISKLEFLTTVKIKCISHG